MSQSEQLKQLLALQRVDTEIRALERELARMPEQLAQAEEEENGVKTQVEEGQARVEAVLKKRRDLESEIESIGQQIMTFETQKLSVKTNDEFRAINTQIDHAKTKRSSLEDGVLTSYDDEETTREKAGQLEAKLDAAAKRTAARREELEARSGIDKKRLAELKESRERIVPGVDKAILTRYENIRDRKGGVAVAGVQNGNCGGCFSALPPQLVNEVKAHRALQYCEHCGRFLVQDPDEA